MVEEKKLIQDLNVEVFKAKNVFRVYNNKFRKKIINFLIKHDRPMTVTEIYKGLKIEQSVASQHLKQLRDVGLVTPTRYGKEIHYSLNDQGFQQLLRVSREVNSTFTPKHLPTHHGNI